MIRKFECGDPVSAQAAEVSSVPTCVSDNSDLIDTFLQSQARAIRWQLALAAFFVLVGAGLIAIGSLVSQQYEASFPKSALLSLGGLFSSTLSALPIKDFIARREKADALRLLKSRLTRAAADGGNPEEVARIDAALWKVLHAVIER